MLVPVNLAPVVFITACSFAMAQDVAFSVPETVATPVSAPTPDGSLIRLSGFTANPSAESWVSLVTNDVPPGVAKANTPELVVWNVSRPTLQPFLPGAVRATGAAMVVVPGGAFMGLAIDREGYAVARWLNAHGIAAFVLKYRVAALPADWDSKVRQEKAVLEGAMRNPPDPAMKKTMDDAIAAAQADALESVGYVRQHASRWHVASDRIGIIGFSAGALTALNVVSQAEAVDRPNLVVSVYGTLMGDRPIPLAAPPAFIAAATDDSTLASSSSLAVYSAFRKAMVPAELHIFENGGHGFGVLRQGKSSDQWMELLDRWLLVHRFTF